MGHLGGCPQRLVLQTPLNTQNLQKPPISSQSCLSGRCRGGFPLRGNKPFLSPVYLTSLVGDSLGLTKEAKRISYHVLGETSRIPWDSILRVIDQGGPNIKLGEQEYIDLGALSWNTGLNTVAGIPEFGANLPLDRPEHSGPQ